jgi:hypothetical protein
MKLKIENQWRQSMKPKASALIKKKGLNLTKKRNEQKEKRKEGRTYKFLISERKEPSLQDVDLVNIKKIIKGYNKQLYAHKCDNLELE